MLTGANLDQDEPPPRLPFPGASQIRVTIPRRARADPHAMIFRGAPKPNATRCNAGSESGQYDSRCQIQSHLYRTDHLDPWNNWSGRESIRRTVLFL